MNYQNIFDNATMQKLLVQSKNNLDKLRKDFNYRGPNSVANIYISLLQKFSEVEEEHKDELEALAIQVVKENFPIIKYANIKIKATLNPESLGNSQELNDEDDEDDIEPNDDYDSLPEVKKRRIINAITHGGSVAGTFAYKMYKDVIESFSPGLSEDYQRAMELTFGVYDDEDYLAMLMTMFGSNMGEVSGGQSSATHEKDEEGNEQLKINAEAICFPMLVHEIVKGLYEIVSWQGFGPSKAMNKYSVQRSDKVELELDDMRFGRYIYNALNSLFIQSNITDIRIRELFFAEVYKLPDEQFIQFIQNVIQNKLTTLEKQWVIKTLNNLKNNLNETITLKKIDKIILDALNKN